MTMEENAEPAGQNSSRRSIPAPIHYAFKYLVNPLMKGLLRSPLHGLVSQQLLLLTFRGRKSGRAYTTPLSYSQEGDTLYLTTESGWWKNLRGGAPVTVRLRGEKRQGQATPAADPESVARFLQRDLEEKGVDYLRRRYRLDLASDQPSFEELVEAAEGTVLITVDLSA